MLLSHMSRASRSFLIGGVFAVSLLGWCFTSRAAPSAKFVGYRVSADGQLYATVEKGDGPSDILVEKQVRAGTQALVVDGGYALLYHARGSAQGGYENESEAVRRYDVRGTKKTVLDKPLKVRRLREVRAKSTRPVYVVSMADGGAGISTLYLVDSTKGEIWSRGAAQFESARDGKVTVALYPHGEDGVDAPSTGKLTLDLDALLDKAYRYKK